MGEQIQQHYPLTVKKFIPAIAWFIILSFALFTPGHDLPDVGSWFTQIDFDKLIHVGVFGMLGLCCMWPIGKSAMANDKKRQLFIKIALSISIFGLASEFIQKYFVPGRNFDIFDWLADSIGSFASLFLCRKKFTGVKK
ncbi:MAG: VanZ family protein [Ferruginibacter sp.]